MALQLFIVRRGKLAELHSDRGTNFPGGEKELKEAFSTLSSDVQQHLVPHQILFHFNPPAEPYFGSEWECKIHSAKAALYTTIGSQSVSEKVLRTIFIEIHTQFQTPRLCFSQHS